MSLAKILRVGSKRSVPESVEQQLDQIATALESATNGNFDAQLGTDDGSVTGRLSGIAKAAVAELRTLKAMASDKAAQVNAINRAMFVIEFQLDGTILTANDNFLQSMGYTLVEVQGKHHQIFVATEDAASPEYEALWQALRNGEFRSEVFRRITKCGDSVWIRASYVPVKDRFGKPYKVVKYALDITELMSLTDR